MAWEVRIYFYDQAGFVVVGTYDDRGAAESKAEALLKEDAYFRVEIATPQSSVYYPTSRIKTIEIMEVK